MKIKPILISAASIILLMGVFFWVRSKSTVIDNKPAINQFLTRLNNYIKEGNTEAALACFDATENPKQLITLVNFLAGKKLMDGKGLPHAIISLDMDGSRIDNVNSNLITAYTPAKFTSGLPGGESSMLTFSIHKAAPGQYKIINIDAHKFLKDYMVYENLVKSKSEAETDNNTAYFSPLTLAAFKTAGQLKARYTRVIWFNHLDNKTYFYVIKGKPYEEPVQPRKSEGNPGYKMGLVNPQLKEIIPAEYDLIHNISGTVKGLVEVEKGDKKGLYDLYGKNVVPAAYDEIFPLKNDHNLALLRRNNDYFYLKSDFTITEKLPDFKIANIVSKIKSIGDSYTLSGDNSINIMEYNSRDYPNSLVIPPSYLVQLQILPVFFDFKNPLRHYGTSKNDNYYGYIDYAVKAESTKQKNENWLESTFHSIVNDYVDARFQLYELKNVVVPDKKQNRLLGFSAGNYFGYDEGTGIPSGKCNENSLRAVNDSLFEFKTTGYLDLILFNESDTLKEGPYYHYLRIQNGKLETLNTNRLFNCTKFVKLDDSYFDGCFVINNKAVNHITPEILQYMKNEIYASYHYQFKKARWVEVFARRFDAKDKGGNANVESLLSPIEKYNVAWINSKLNKAKPNTTAAK